MAKAKKQRHGGSGRGQGRKPKYNEKTKPISFRLPESLVNKIRASEEANRRAYEALKKEFE